MNQQQAQAAYERHNAMKALAWRLVCLSADFSLPRDLRDQLVQRAYRVEAMMAPRRAA